MPGRVLQGLSGLRAASPFPRGHSKRSSGGILDRGDEDKYRLSNRRIPRLRWTLRNWRTLGYLAGAAALLALLFFPRYQMHVEVQLFKRGWIREAILPVRPPPFVDLFQPGVHRFDLLQPLPCRSTVPR
ncbi:hypothetical protein JCM8547_009302 [Rhodosporidiobolus lusitaniae]